MKSFLTFTAALIVLSSFAAGCAGPEEDTDEEMGESTSSISGYVTGKCPDNHVCAYENANYNDRNPTSAWAYQFGPEELYQAALGRKFQRRFTGGKDKVSSIINNSKITVCLINESLGGFRSTKILRVAPGQRFGSFGAAANDKADRIEEC